MARRIGPADWLKVVDDDLKAIRACLAAEPPVLLPAVYHCQQAAEKLVKTVLVSQGIDFPKTHDIDRLAQSVPETVSIRAMLVPMARFTPYAAVYRYPGESHDLSDEPTASEVASWLAEIESVRAEVERFLAP
ncbi:HEPN domain-containing protein [Azospirillum sp. sgz301742]